MTIEMILLLASLLGIALFVSKQAQEKKFMASLVSGPWKPLQGMMEDGVWVDPKESKNFHPTKKSRHGSYIGDPVP